MSFSPFSYHNPADAAMPYLKEIPETITPYYQPYIDSGNDALQTLISQYSTLLSNPGDVISNAGKGYQQSPGYQYNLNAGMNAANASAAAGGTLGTAANQQQSSQVAEDIANQDYQQYLNQALGLYQQGLAGEQGLNAQGYSASNTLASDLGANLQSEAGLAYNGVQGQNAANSSMAKLIGQGAGYLFGGPMGGAVGGGLFGGSGSTPVPWLNPDTMQF